MKWKSHLALALAVAACVPASEAAPPAGAGGFSVEPSAAAKGEPFDVDGWSLTIENLCVSANLSVTPNAASEPGEPDGSRQSGDTHFLFDATKGGELYATAVSPGPAEACLLPTHFTSFYAGLELEPSRPGGDVIMVGDVDPADLARFRDYSDEGPTTTASASSYATYGNGPSVLFALTAQRGDRVVRLEVAPNLPTPSPPRNARPDVPPDLPPQPDRLREEPGLGKARDRSLSGRSCAARRALDVRANALTLGPLLVTPERIFTRAPLLWPAIVKADANSDGLTTGKELRAVTITETSALRQYGDNLLKALARLLSDELFGE